MPVSVEKEFDFGYDSFVEKTYDADKHARIAFSERGREIHLEAPVCVGARERSLYYTKL